VYDENSEEDDEKQTDDAGTLTTDDAGTLTTVDSVFDDDDQKRSTLCDDHTTTTTGDELGSCRDVDEAKFTYMNAADLAEALHAGRDDVMRVRSVHSDHRDSDPHHSAGNPASTDSRDNPSPSSPPSSRALPAAEPVDDCTSDVTPRASEIPVESSSDPAREPDASSGKGGRSNGVRDALSTSPSSSPRRPSDVREDGAQGGSMEGGESDGMNPASQVTMRRPSRPLITPSHAAVTATVIELHVDPDLKPITASDHFQLDELSTESGSAVEALRQFIANDRCCGRSSAQTVPTAIQPGKAFHSLKYFLSTLH